MGAVTAGILAQLLSTCAGDRLVDIRDRAILLTAFASGGRRRSEIANLRVEDLVEEEPVHAEPDDPASPPLPSPAWRSASAAPRQHRSLTQAAAYYNNPERRRGKAARLIV